MEVVQDTHSCSVLRKDPDAGSEGAGGRGEVRLNAVHHSTNGTHDGTDPTFLNSDDVTETEIVLRVHRINQLLKELEYIHFRPGGDMVAHRHNGREYRRVRRPPQQAARVHITLYMLDSVQEYGEFSNRKKVVKLANKDTLFKPEDVKKYEVGGGD
ncbi:hypothetical protein PsorP6_012668 [Peronosclerospora sorghi]|uniref:Uncharacterized protein n=1 Tax=Peronosclerospora sorghi TaxID=230839 RepID=A0ACC0WJP4_9STRA|nr:hypothetical protein PsorP6_012668 [Peronosclerospora sorghi]